MKISHRLAIIFKNGRNVAMRHKILSAIIAVAVAGGGYYAYGKLNGGSAEVRYVLAAAQKGTLVASVSGTGQVSALNQIDVKPKASGDVTLVAVNEGQRVKAGTLIVELDAQSAQKTVRDAEANLESAKISLEKMTQPADALSITQAENALAQAQQAKQNAQGSLAKSYEDGFTVLANAFIDLPGVVSGLDSVLNGNAVNGAQANADAYYDLVKTYRPNADQFRNTALDSYKTARAAYDTNLQDYKTASRYSDRATVDSLINETYDTVKLISQAIKDAKSFLDLVNDALIANFKNSTPPAILSAQETSLQSYTATTNTHLANLLNIKNTIKNDLDTITSSDGAITEKTEALAKLKAGADPLDIRSSELAVRQRENALLDAQEALADYYVRAPFDGVVAKIDVKKGDPASSGAAVATVITDQKIAQVSLNEIDVAKTKIGEKATLTFDAFPDLTITGQVVQLDTLGTVTQGVVTYSVKIAFDTQDDRVRPGMSVSAAIITNTKQDVLLVPNAAVKTQAGASYVQVLDTSAGASAQASGNNQGVVSQTPPTSRAVEIGLSNDSMTEITSGLVEGDEVVVRTITGSSQSASQTQSSGGGGGLRIPGLGGGGFRGN